jgi:hypothetical protein
MKDIIVKINEKSELPKLRKLKNIPDWVIPYPDFCDKMEEIWDDDRSLFTSIMYFITKNEKIDEQGWSSMKVDIKDLYHE